MQNRISNKLISLFLALAMLFSSALFLVACSKQPDTDEDANDDSSADSEQNQDKEDGDGEAADWRDKIVVPEYKEYDRLTVKFGDVKYERPNFAKINTQFETLIEIIEKNEISFDEQIAAIVDLEDEYAAVRTMNALANINNSKDASVSYWNEEYAYVSENYPSFAEKIEDMFVAAANSPHAERFEDEYFGEGLIEEYRDGGKFTDRMIELWAEESALEAEYSSISTANVKVTYKGVTDTVDKILEECLEKYGEGSDEYAIAKAFCMEEYNQKTEALYADLLVELIKVRRLIADELNEETYADYAYESFGRDYTAEDMSAFLEDVRDFVVPVFAVLDYYVFYNYFRVTSLDPISLDTLVNESHDIMKNIDPELADIYAYMLQFELYDIEKSSENRMNASFTSYLDSYEAPFIFMCASGNVEDYTTLFHEFGHFVENYINYGSDASLDMQEVSSQGLEYLLLHYASDKLTDKEIKYLTYYQMSSALNVLVYQSFYAKFEELAYAIPYDEISKESLDAAVVSAAQFFGFNTEQLNNTGAVSIPHIFLYPFYVQSYCTSVIPALMLYFLEDEAEGKGLEAYLHIIDHTEEELDFIACLKQAGLDSPFGDGVLRDIADKIYYEIVGSHYYTEKDDQNAA